MNEPKVIFLQMGDEYEETEDSFLDCEDITWCIDSQFETDIEYCKITAAELAALRARVGELERERDELQGLVFDISGWLSNWEPDFTEDDEWEDVAKRIDAALAKGAK